MLEMKINPNKLEVKYALELYKEVPGFPSHRDITYVMIRALEDKGLLEKEFNAGDIWSHMKMCFGTGKELHGFLDYVSSVDECPAEELLLQKIGTDKNGGIYKLIRNPWM
jgi:hypothetical protein